MIIKKIRPFCNTKLKTLIETVLLEKDKEIFVKFRSKYEFESLLCANVFVEVFTEIPRKEIPVILPQLPNESLTKEVTEEVPEKNIDDFIPEEDLTNGLDKLCLDEKGEKDENQF